MFTPTRHARRALISAIAAAAIGTAVSSVVTAEPAAPSKGERNGCSTAIENRNLANFNTYLDALLSGDFATANSYFVADGVVEVHGASLPFAGTYTVSNGAYAALQLQYWDFSNVGTPARPTLYADCDKVILKGPFQRIAKATGKPIDTTVIEFFTFNREGRIVRDDFYFTDTAAVKAVLGLP